MAKVVYVVDDELLVCSTFTQILNKFGFDAVPFNDPVQALESAAVNVPDIAITDVLLPELSGIELAQRIKEMHPPCKVMLLTALPSAMDLIEAAGSPGQDFELLPKPIHPEDLIAALKIKP